MSVLNKIKNSFKNIIRNNYIERTENILLNCFKNYNIWFKTNNLIEYSITDTTIFHQYPPLSFFEKVCQFTPQNSSSNILGKIQISALLFERDKYDIGQFSQDLIIDRYNFNFNLDKRKEIALKLAIYHELSHVYQYDLFLQNKFIFDNNFESQELSQFSYYFNNNIMTVKSKPLNNIKAKTQNYILTVAQEMYADCFALACLAIDLSFDNRECDFIYKNLNYARKGQVNKNKDFIYSYHTTEQALSYFNYTNLKEILKTQKNKESAIHLFVSECALKGIQDFIAEYCNNLSQNIFILPNQNEKQEIFELVLKQKPIINNQIASKIQLFKSKDYFKKLKFK